MGREVMDGIDRGKVCLYTLTSCAWCERMKLFLNHLGVKHETVDVDECPEAEQARISAFLDSLSGQWGFPALVVNDATVICGFKPNAIARALGMEEKFFDMQLAAVDDGETRELQGKLEALASKKGLRLNPQQDMAARLIKGLIVNQKKFGYRACPCRLATGDRDSDRDIICPCEYRDADIEEYGSCYCALYVTEDVFNGVCGMPEVPERRRKQNGSSS